MDGAASSAGVFPVLHPFRHDCYRFFLFCFCFLKKGSFVFKPPVTIILHPFRHDSYRFFCFVFCSLKKGFLSLNSL